MVQSLKEKHEDECTCEVWLAACVYDWSGCPLHDPTMNQPELTTEFSSRDVTGGQDG